MESKTADLCIYPLKNLDVWEMYKTCLGSFWVPEEIAITDDLSHWPKMSASERFLIKMVLAFFAQADQIVNDNLVENFIHEIGEHYKEAKYFYSMQSTIECIHAETYAILLDTYITDGNEKAQMFDAIQNFASIRKKAEWAQEYTDPQKKSLAERLMAFMIVEGLFFAGAFCVIFYFRDRGVLHGLSQSNQLISKDESAHVRFGALMYQKMIDDGLIERLSPREVHRAFKRAVEIEKEFITESIPTRLLGINAELMGQYIEFVADYLLKMLGYETIYDVKCPFAFMENISIQSKVNFFERRNEEYQITLEGQDINFTDDLDF